MKEVEQCRYHSQSLWTITRFGHFLNAMLTGMAVLIPSFLAGMDAAVIMLLLSDGSPDTADGTSLMSGPPSVNNLTALQLRNAEFTSMWKMTRFMEKSVLSGRYLLFSFRKWPSACRCPCRCFRSPLCTTGQVLPGPFLPMTSASGSCLRHP